MASKFEPLEPWGSMAADSASNNSPKDAQQPDPLKADFLDHIAAGQSVRSAASTVGVKPSTPYAWRKQDERFAAAWEAAEEAGTDIIEEEAFRRAVTGVEKPVYRGGEVVGHIADYSDAMLMFLLKSRRPERYGNSGKTVAGKISEDLNLKGVRDALVGKFNAVASGIKTPTVSDQPD